MYAFANERRMAAAIGIFLVRSGKGDNRQRERRWSIELGLLLMVCVLGWVGCGGSSAAKSSNPGTPPGSYSVTLTAVSGSLSHSVTVQFEVQ